MWMYAQLSGHLIDAGGHSLLWDTADHPRVDSEIEIRAGYCRARCPAIANIYALACSSVTPGLGLTTTPTASTIRG